jgi:hypothetical protein
VGRSREVGSRPWRSKVGREHEFLLLSDEYEGSSTRSDEGQLWWIHAELSLPHLHASTRAGIVWGVDVSLSEFFDDLTQNWRGWKGVEKWKAYEGGLGLFCSADRLGHITVTVELREGSPERWLVRGNVPLDAGQLEALAREMRGFFSYRDSS